MARKVDLGVTKLLWVPGEAGIADKSAPQLAELNAAGVLDLTCLMVTTYEVRADTSDTTNERAVCETANVVTPTIQNYMGDLVLFRDFDDETQEFTMDDALATFVWGHLGWFVRRLALPHATALADGQQIETYKFMSDTPQVQGGTGQGYLKATIPLHQQGNFDVRAIIGGAES
jgi:hypothetical protein